MFTAWTCGDHVKFKANVHISDNVENGIISSNNSKVVMIMTAWAVLPKDAEGFLTPVWQRLRKWQRGPHSVFRALGKVQLT